MLDPKTSLLAKIKTGVQEKPHLVLIYGPDGVGKSTFAANAPETVFLGPESGTKRLNVARFPTPKTFFEFQTSIHELTTLEHPFQTLAIDSLDWLEPLLWSNLCSQHQVKSIEQIGGGYGKGFTYAIEEWRRLLIAISQLQEKRGMNVIFIAHSQVKTFQDPQTQAGYDRYQLKLNEKAAALFREYVDSVLFCNFETFTKKDGQKTRAYGDGARILYTERRPAFDAKNRDGLPFELPLSWDDYAAAVKRGAPDTPEQLSAEILKLLENSVVDENLKALVMSTLEKGKGNPTALAAIKNRLAGKIKILEGEKV